MRHIGTAGIQCFDGPCQPWSKSGPVCLSCAIRPMKIYQGNAGSKVIVSWCQDNGYGILISPGWWKTPSRYPYYCLDNGAFPAWTNGKHWDEALFLKFVDKAINAEIPPDFIVCPDKVAEGAESLAFSMEWLDKLPKGPRYYLAVQDGMTKESVESVIRSFAGLFVGGTMDWKLRTSEKWVDLAHEYLRPCHIGRVGPWDRILWAARIGADSIDSTTWTRFQDRRYHLEYAKCQTLITEEVTVK